MLEELFAIHSKVIKNTPLTRQRYLATQVNWESRCICIYGDRGVGKTTLLCQQLIERYDTVKDALYLSADNILVNTVGLFKLAQQYFAYGGKALFIDEIHKYPNWTVEVKNIVDTYRDKRVALSGSSSMDLHKGKGDLSRRVVYYKLLGLSFREYLALTHNDTFPAYTLHDMLENHVTIAEQLREITPLKHFHQYLKHGYYPYFLEGVDDFLLKLNNVIEKVLFEDIAVVKNAQQSTIILMKKILWLIATAEVFTPNIDRMSKDLQASREMIYNCIDYLEQAGLISSLYANARGLKLVRKPAKIFLNNTNLLYAIYGSLKLGQHDGPIRETFIVNQLQAQHRLSPHATADFIVDGQFVIEVGGKGKNNAQLKGEKRAYLAVDQLEIGAGNRIPLYLFGFLY